MKKIFSSIIVAVFAVTMIFAGTAQADWTAPANDAAADTWAIQDAAEDDIALIADPVYTFTAAIPQDAIMIVSLGGGAKFEEAPNGGIAFSDASAGGVDILMLGAPAAGDTSFMVLVTGGDIAATDTLTISDAGTLGLNLSSVAVGNVSISITACNQAQTLTFLPSMTRIIVVADDVAEADATTASATETIDVAQEKMQLVLSTGANALASEVAQYQVTNGTVTIGADDIAIEKLLFTITGDMSAVDTITAAGVTGCDATGDQTDGTAGEFLIDADNNVAYASNTAIVDDDAAAALNNPLDLNDIVVTFDGETVIQEGSYTIQGTILEDNFDQFALDEFIFLTLEYNGATFATASVGQYNTIKITDRSGNLPEAGATIYITAYDADGNVLSEVSGATSWTLTSDGTVSITGSELQANYDTTPIRYEFAIESSSVVCTNVKVKPDGFSSTVYSSAGDGGL